MHDDAQMRSEVVWPEDNREQPSPEAKVEIADAEKPPREPGAAHKGMLLYFDFLHVQSSLPSKDSST